MKKHILQIAIAFFLPILVPIWAMECEVDYNDVNFPSSSGRSLFHTSFGNFCHNYLYIPSGVIKFVGSSIFQYKYKEKKNKSILEDEFSFFMIPINDRDQIIDPPSKEEYQLFLNEAQKLPASLNNKDDFMALETIKKDVERSEIIDRPDFFPPKGRLTTCLIKVLSLLHFHYKEMGYFQGLHDIASSLIQRIFDTEYKKGNKNSDLEQILSLSSQDLEKIQATAFTSLCRIVSPIIKKLKIDPKEVTHALELGEMEENILEKTDSELSQHIKQFFELKQIIFQWNITLFTRELNPNSLSVLMDQYYQDNEGEGFISLHPYFCIAVILFHKEKILEMKDFVTLYRYLRDLELNNLDQSQVKELILSAKQLRRKFGDEAKLMVHF